MCRARESFLACFLPALLYPAPPMCCSKLFPVSHMPVRAGGCGAVSSGSGPASKSPSRGRHLLLKVDDKKRHDNSSTIGSRPSFPWSISTLAPTTPELLVSRSCTAYSTPHKQHHHHRMP
ncbi:hypothetical protein HDK77DRAFT_87470 [Phyllosticta capitalensis]